MRPRSAIAPSPTWLCLLGAVLVLFGAHAGRYWDFTVDDAGISFAYARNLATGHGLVMTPGAERVEAATNLAWILVLTPAHWLGDQHELLAKVLGLVFASGALAAVALFPSVAYQRKPRYFDCVAPLIAAVMPHYALWAVSGLENGMFSCVAALALLAVAREENDPDSVPWSALWLALLFATRPDGLLYIGAIGCAKLLRQISPRPPRQDLAWGVLLALGLGGIELFRLAYYAWPFPNSFYAKRRTFEFGKDLFDTRTAGWTYLGTWLRDYKLTKALYVVPVMLLGLRAPVARIAAFGFVCTALFFAVYSHGDWMEEYRFLTFGAPFIALAFAEAARAAARLVQLVVPAPARGVVALVLTPVAAYFVLAETTQHYPARMHAATQHTTLPFSFVRGRAHYFAAALRRLHVGRAASLLDPDVGGSSYEGQLQVVDLFGLGDIAVAHTHPNNPPGSREAIFGERRPTFVHLHGAWYGAMELTRLEELDQGYLRLPGRMPSGEYEPDANWVRRESIAAPWYVTAITEPPAGVERRGVYVSGYTVSHRALEPGHRMAIELLVANATADTAGAVLLQPAAGGRAQEAPVQLAGGLIPAAQFLPGERPRAWVEFAPAAGRYTLSWRGADGRVGALGELVVRAGAGARESAALRDTLVRALDAGRFADAGRVARTLGVRVSADPRDDVALDGLHRYGVALADRARVIAADGGAYHLAAVVAREARAWAAHDTRTASRVNAVAEVLADQARAAEGRGQFAEAFSLAVDSVLMDPRRSWSRRRAEELRPRRAQRYDGGRDQAAYRLAAAVMTGQASLDRAAIVLGSVDRYLEAASLADAVGTTPTDPRARVVVARGLLSRGEATQALALVAGVPCAGAHDPELTRGLRAVFGRPYRPGDTQCEAQPPAVPAPFDPANGSFELGRRGWGAWTVSGNAFGPRPAHDHPVHQSFVNGWHAWHFASSFVYDSDARTGVLRSPPFVVRGEGISFLVGGGSDVDHVGVRLMINGTAVVRASGSNTEGFRRVFWDVRAHAGQTATLEVYDEATGGWGHIMADDFRIEPVAPNVVSTDAP